MRRFVPSQIVKGMRFVNNFRFRPFLVLCIINKVGRSFIYDIEWNRNYFVRTLTPIDTVKCVGRGFRLEHFTKEGHKWLKEDPLRFGRTQLIWIQ